MPLCICVQRGGAEWWFIDNSWESSGEPTPDPGACIIQQLSICLWNSCYFCFSSSICKTEKITEMHLPYRAAVKIKWASL